ncbi:unnamed protein product [Rodentolepis nana]|uniref:Uncharacterized protein n=1 Tax=Rodentolepis nana TaxID=102285 RepID=A0A3P7WLB8_RODNA|nr:unnamed protein product [Rodentolepis nana]
MITIDTGSDEVAKNGAVSGEDDESLGLLSLGDMDNADSEFLMSQ